MKLTCGVCGATATSENNWRCNRCAQLRRQKDEHRKRLAKRLTSSENGARFPD